jgi:UDP-N-acetylmuramoyl-tripeptide--D-alanyl-D-alanine ligase
VPLTLVRTPLDSRYAVYEIGMSNPGEIAPLARWHGRTSRSSPRSSRSTWHAFPSVDAIADEKAAIYDGLPPTASPLPTPTCPRPRG